MGLKRRVDSIKEINEKKAEQAAIPVRLSGNEQALAELGVLAAQNEVMLAGIQQAVAEIGELVGGN